MPERRDLFAKRDPEGPYRAGTPGKNASTLTRTPPAKIREYVRLRSEGMNKSAAAREVGISKPTAYAIENLMSAQRQEQNQRRNRTLPSTVNSGLSPDASTSKKTMAGGRAGHGNPWANQYATLLGDEGLPGPLHRDELSDVAREALEDFALFRRRYFGRGPSPWQVDAGIRIAELLHSAQESRDREYVVLNAPPGAGKSTLWHDVIIWLICRDRSVRILYGSRTTGQAMKYTRRVRRSLMQRDLIFPDERDLAAGLAVAPEGVLVEDFGRFKPQGRNDGDVWQMGGFTVAQPGDVLTAEKEPTVTAFGFDADYMGMRVDLAVWDDLVDPANVRTIDVIEKLQEDWDNVAEARIDPGGVNVLQGQRIRHNDLYRYCLDKRRASEEDEEDEPAEFVPKYRHILYPAHMEDRCRGLHKRTDVAADPSRPAGDDNPGCLLDPRRIPWRDIKTMSSEQPDTYRVVWQQEDLDPGAALVQKIWVDGGKDPTTGTLYIGCWDHDRPMWKLPPAGAIPPPNHLALVVDPSPSNWWACQLWLTNQHSERRYLLALDRLRMSAPEFLDWDADKGRFTGFLEEWWLRAADMGMPFRFVVLEVNAAQKWLLQYDHAKRWAQKRSVNYVPHTTGVLKTDAQRGIPAVKGHWRSGRIRLPGAPDGSMQKSMLLVNEMLRWPNGMTDDQVMAHWFNEHQLPKLAPAKPQRQVRSHRPSWLRRSA